MTNEPSTSHPTSERSTDVQSTSPLSSIRGTIKLPPGWFDHSVPNYIHLCKVIDNSLSECQQVVITHSFNHSERSFVEGIHSWPWCEWVPALNLVSQQVNEGSAMELLNLVDRLKVCPGHPEKKFIKFAESRKGKLCNRAGDVFAYIDHHSPVYLNGQGYPSTVRTVKCDMLIHGGKC